MTARKLARYSMRTFGLWICAKHKGVEYLRNGRNNVLLDIGNFKKQWTCFPVKNRYTREESDAILRVEYPYFALPYEKDLQRELKKVCRENKEVESPPRECGSKV